MRHRLLYSSILFLLSTILGCDKKDGISSSLQRDNTGTIEVDNTSPSWYRQVEVDSSEFTLGFKEGGTLTVEFENEMGDQINGVNTYVYVKGQIISLIITDTLKRYSPKIESIKLNKMSLKAAQLAQDEISVNIHNNITVTLDPIFPDQLNIERTITEFGFLYDLPSNDDKWVMRQAAWGVIRDTLDELTGVVIAKYIAPLVGEVLSLFVSGFLHSFDQYFYTPDQVYILIYSKVDGVAFILHDEGTLTGAIVGQVRDQQTRNGFAGVDIQITGNESVPRITTTLNNGYYRADGIVPSGTYTIIINKQGYTGEELSVDVLLGKTTLAPDIFISQVNSPPFIPQIQHPTHSSEGIPISDSLSWIGGDPNGDSVTYDVYLGTDSTPDSDELVSENQSNLEYHFDSLMEGTQYYWKIVSTDSSGNKVEGPIWYFSTILKGNSPPRTPSIVYPANNSTDLDTKLTLQWAGGDPDGDEVTYDVYFGTDSTPDTGELVSNNQSNLNYITPSLQNDISYYWRLVAQDSQGNVTEGPVWTFTTRGEANSDPYKPENPSPSNNEIDQSINLILTWSGGDPDGDDVTYEVYFGTDSTPDASELVSGGQTSAAYNLSNLNYETRYYWKIIAQDTQGNIAEGSTWNFTTQSEPLLSLPDEIDPFSVDIDEVKILATSDPDRALAICQNMKTDHSVHRDIQDECLAAVAIIIRDVQVCDSINKEVNNKFNCILDVAVEKGDSELCEKLPTDLYKDNCYTKIAQRIRNEDVCLKISSSRQRNFCRSLFR